MIFPSSVGQSDLIKTLVYNSWYQHTRLILCLLLIYSSNSMGFRINYRTQPTAGTRATAGTPCMPERWTMFWRLIIIKRYFLYMCCWFLQYFLKKTQSFNLLLWNYLLILKILSVTLFKEPKAAILTLKMLTGSYLWFCKIIPEAACDKLILAHFPCSQWGAITRELLDCNFKEANKKLIIV